MNVVVSAFGETLPLRDGATNYAIVTILPLKRELSVLDLLQASLLNRASTNRGNSVMAKAPTKHRAPWTTVEVRELKSLARKKLGREKIAQKLKRTPASVQNRAVSEGISLSTR